MTAGQTTTDPIIRVEDLVVEFSVPAGTVQAVSSISLHVPRGAALGLVGESGCGKSTLARAIMMITRPTSGSVEFDGIDLTRLRRGALRRLRPRLQMVFQDPISSLNPYRKVRDTILDGPRTWGRDVDPAAVAEVLSAVGIDQDAIGDRRPSEFSGGQCQRIAIARALMMQPEVIVCDEVVAALDVSVQAQVLNLLRRLRRERDLTLLFISHDLGVVRNICEQVAVMYLGRICEVGPVRPLYAEPAHPYTRALLDSVPRPRSEQLDPPIRGDVPSPLNPPSGCRFRTRCPRAQQRCAVEEAALRPIGGGREVACHFPLTGSNS